MSTAYSNDILYIILLTGLICFMLSLIFHESEKGKLTVIFLLLTAFAIFCFAALLDPFLNLWDERFHALVAKNLVNHPLKPTLYDEPIVNMPYDRWDRYHIWLHKQPLFLWQIAASFRLFGISEFTLRLPSAILGVILVLIGYRSGKLLVSKMTGYITGILIITSFYILELIAGRKVADHNDVSFLVYISLSIWSFIEYRYSKKKKWIYLIGLFSGLAILCKWLTGLLVYFGWYVLKIAERKWKFKDYKDILVSLLITILISLPWQLFTIIYYPDEAKLAQQYNVRHLFEPIEGHNGTCWYYFDQFNNLYGNFASILIIPALIVLYKKITDKKLFLSILSMIVIVYLFFSIVQTKMPSFPIIVAMLIFISLATILDYGLNLFLILRLKGWINKLIVITILLLLAFSRFNIGQFQAGRPLWRKDSSNSQMLIYNKGVFQSLRLPENAVIFNVKGQHYIESMFYTGLPSYHIIPSLEQYNDIKIKGKIIAIFKPTNNELPFYLKNDKSIIIINEVLQGYN